MEWQPIDTAPKEKLVLVTSGSITAPAIFKYRRWYFWEGEMAVDENGDDCGELNYWIKDYGPTHWMDFPDAPKDQTHD